MEKLGEWFGNFVVEILILMTDLIPFIIACVLVLLILIIFLLEIKNEKHE